MAPKVKKEVVIPAKSPITALDYLHLGLKYDNPDIAKDDLLIIVYWFKQCLAVVFGLIWGFSKFTGWQGFAGFIVMWILATFLYCAKFLKLDPDDSSQFDVMAEGFMASNGMFLVF